MGTSIYFYKLINIKESRLTDLKVLSPLVTSQYNIKCDCMEILNINKLSEQTNTTLRCLLTIFRTAGVVKNYNYSVSTCKQFC